MMKIFFTVFVLTLNVQAFARTYVLPTHIGNRIFNDLLVIESESPLKGTLIVPGQFNAPIMDGRQHIAYEGRRIQFSILARENGRSYKVFYRLVQYHGMDQIDGELTLGDRSILGHVLNGYEKIGK